MSNPPEQAGQEPTAQPTPAPAADDASAAAARLAIVERELKEARSEAAKYRTERRQQEAQAQEAEVKRLAEAGEFKTLAEQRAADVARLSAEVEQAKTTAKELERYQVAIAAIVAPRLEGLSDQLKKLVSGLEPLAQLEWVAALASAAPTAPARPGAPVLTPTAPAANRDAPQRPQGGWTLSDIYNKR